MYRRTLGVILTTLGIAACGSDGTQYGRAGDVTFQSARLALTSSQGLNVLRLNDALLVESEAVSDALRPNTKYQLTVTNGASYQFVGGLLTDTTGRVPASTLAHDIGLFSDGVKVGDLLTVTLDDGTNRINGAIAVKGHLFLEGPGFAVDEVAPPNVYAADASGKAINAFVVGGADPGEVAGPVYAAGDSFPRNATVSIYVVRDRDQWKRRPFPARGETDLLAGPVTAKTDAEGRLPATNTGFAPKGSQDLGVYDIIVDVDRNGVFDWSASTKDAADGENKVGLTVQYSQAWLRSQASKHVIVNLAFNNASRDNGQYQNMYATGMVYAYVNPPTFNYRDDYHRTGIYVLIKHQSWTNFWNNPDPALDADPNVRGSRDLTPYSVTSGGGTGDFVVPAQPGCMNAPPVGLLNATSRAVDKNGADVKDFDIVFLPNQKDTNRLIYVPGTSLLDLNVNNSSSHPIDPTKIDDSIAKGFSVVK
ncbi:MAG: hypothetical protein IT371_03535 [Deltaproteobacteria bacterium]|nr:hypothetical protein [Deltaproteobacteria bacterium]